MLLLFNVAYVQMLLQFKLKLIHVYDLSVADCKSRLSSSRIPFSSHRRLLIRKIGRDCIKSPSKVGLIVE